MGGHGCGPMPTPFHTPQSLRPSLQHHRSLAPPITPDTPLEPTPNSSLLSPYTTGDRFTYNDLPPTQPDFSARPCHDTKTCTQLTTPPPPGQHQPPARTSTAPPPSLAPPAVPATSGGSGGGAGGDESLVAPLQQLIIDTAHLQHTDNCDNDRLLPDDVADDDDCFHPAVCTRFVFDTVYKGAVYTVQCTVYKGALYSV